MNKTLKFKPHLISRILDGSKTITWRLFDDKDLQKGDQLLLAHSDTGEIFAKAIIVVIHEKEIRNLTKSDLAENGYRDMTEVHELNRKYYGDRVNDETMVKIVEFALL